jgi:hypothetical protein
LKDCGVGMAMLPGYSWAAHSSTGWWRTWEAVWCRPSRAAASSTEGRLVVG